MKCVCKACGRGPKPGLSLFRQNEKGQEAEWLCSECNRKSDAELDGLVALIERESLVRNSKLH